MAVGEARLCLWWIVRSSSGSGVPVSAINSTRRIRRSLLTTGDSHLGEFASGHALVSVTADESLDAGADRELMRLGDEGVRECEAPKIPLRRATRQIQREINIPNKCLDRFEIRHQPDLLRAGRRVSPSHRGLRWKDAQLEGSLERKKSWEWKLERKRVKGKGTCFDC